MAENINQQLDRVTAALSTSTPTAAGATGSKPDPVSDEETMDAIDQIFAAIATLACILLEPAD